MLVGEGQAGDKPGRLLRLATVWDSEREAGEFYGGMQALLPQLEAAAAGLSDRERDSGVTLEYGEREDMVVLTSWFSVDSRDQRKLSDGL